VCGLDTFGRPKVGSHLRFQGSAAHISPHNAFQRIYLSLMVSGDDINLTDEQLHTILADVLTLYGYDFTSYSHGSIRRRIARLMSNDGFKIFDAFRDRLRDDKQYFGRFLEQITVNVTEMFRDVSFYRLLREQVLPTFKSSQPIRIWHAGCSTGEEVYSMAIMLEEAGLLNESELYATDINPAVLASVKAGIFPLAHMQQHRENYLRSGGTSDLSYYYNIEEEGGRFLPSLGRNTIVTHHNLVSDKPYGKWNLIMCRNVLIYFERELQERVLKIFYDSLLPGGFLALGSKETIRFSGVEKYFTQVKEGEKIWRRKK
jgi:chemotaxis protein methyltransferase CheR